MEEVKLVSHWASGFSQRVQMALKAKRINFQYLEENILNKSELLLSSNPVYKKLPVLIHNGKSICESQNIIEYIDEVWSTAPPLLPTHPYDRFLVRFWSDFFDRKASQITGEVPSLKLKSEEERASLMKKMQGECSEMGLNMERGVAELEQRGCLYDGENLKYMDIIFAPSVSWFAASEELLGLRWFDCEKCPCLHIWVQNLLTNDVVKSTLPDEGKIMEYARAVWV